MNKLNFAYCNNCKSLTWYILQEEVVEEISEFGDVKYGLHKVARCKRCDCVVVGIIYDYTKPAIKFGSQRKEESLIMNQTNNKQSKRMQ